MKKKTIKTIPDQPFNDLSFLPPDKESTETKNILRQVIKSSIALAELKGLVHTLPNPNILLNAVILKEAKASSEIENVITTQDKLYEALSAKGMQTDTATKEVLRYREAMLSGFELIKKKDFINTNIIIQVQRAIRRK